MKGRICKLAITLLTIGAASTGFATTTLNEVFQQAQQNDPTYLGAAATYQAAKTAMPLAYANLLPTLAGTAGYAKVNSAGDASHYWTTTWGATLTQNIFDWSAFAGVGKAKATVRGALAAYQDARQTLIQSTISAYLTVIQNAATVEYNHAYTNQLLQLLKQQKQKFKVGIIPITDVYQAQSNYDKQVAQNIADQNTLNSSIESLRAITGQSYASIKGVGATLPLHSPNPNKMQTWVNTALKQNLSIMGAQAQVDIDKASVSIDRGAHLPSLAVTGDYKYTSIRNKTANSAISNHNVSSVGLGLTLPIFSGGAMFAQTRQDAFTQQADQQALDATVRSTVASTRTNYMAILAAISGVQAAKQAYVSASQSLKATRAGYQVGTNTIVDVLTNMSNRIQAQQGIVQNQVDYLNAIIALKQVAGTLNDRDVKAVSKILSSVVKLPNTLSSTNYNLGNTSSHAPMTDAQKAAKVNSTGTTTTAATTNKAMSAIKSNASSASSANTYSLQLFVSNSKTRANNFVKQFLSNNKNAFITQHVSNGVTHYVVMYGHYSSLAQGRAAIAKLSKPIQRLQPWVRTLSK